MDTLSGMAKLAKDAKAVLWHNLKALMEARYGGENLYRLHKESGISLGSLSRMKEQQTAVGLDALTRIGEFFGLLPWQLLVPDLDPLNPPVAAMSTRQQLDYERLEAFKQIAAEIIHVSNGHKPDERTQPGTTPPEQPGLRPRKPGRRVTDRH